MHSKSGFHQSTFSNGKEFLHLRISHFFTNKIGRLESQCILLGAIKSIWLGQIEGFCLPKPFKIVCC